jgi:hypothetical protein
LQFGVLVIPDIYAGAQQEIANLLGSGGKTQITNFVEAGGISHFLHYIHQFLTLFRYNNNIWQGSLGT